MDATQEVEPNLMGNDTKVERTSERELVVSRTVNGPARLVFEAWTRPELFRQWWVPKSLGMSLLSCEMDVRVGGTYRLEFDVGARSAHGVLRHVHRCDTALAPRLEQRRRRDRGPSPR